MAELQSAGKFEIELDGQPFELGADDVEVRLQSKSGWTAAQGKFAVVVLATELTDALIREGYARDLVRFIQELRKTRGCQFTDRISVTLSFSQESETSRELLVTIQENEDYIKNETLANLLVLGPAQAGASTETIEVAETSVVLGVHSGEAS